MYLNFSLRMREKSLATPLSPVESTWVCCLFSQARDSPLSFPKFAFRSLRKSSQCQEALGSSLSMATRFLGQHTMLESGDLPRWASSGLSPCRSASLTREDKKTEMINRGCPRHSKEDDEAVGVQVGKIPSYTDSPSPSPPQRQPGQLHWQSWHLAIAELLQVRGHVTWTIHIGFPLQEI